MPPSRKPLPDAALGHLCLVHPPSPRSPHNPRQAQEQHTRAHAGALHRNHSCMLVLGA